MSEDWAADKDGDPHVLTTDPIPEHVVRMTKQVASLRAQVQELSAALAATLKMLTESGQLDRAAIEARIVREHAARCAVRQPPPVVCVKCKKSVPANTTVITANGVICEEPCT